MNYILSKREGELLSIFVKVVIPKSMKETKLRLEEKISTIIYLIAMREPPSSSLDSLNLLIAMKIPLLLGNFL
jgi:hypothetical protein